MLSAGLQALIAECLWKVIFCIKKKKKKCLVVFPSTMQGIFSQNEGLSQSTALPADCNCLKMEAFGMSTSVLSINC